MNKILGPIMTLAVMAMVNGCANDDIGIASEQEEPAVPAADPVGFVAADTLAVARTGHTATLLRDGRVLVVGGEDVVTRDPIDSVELYDPELDSWSTGPALPAPRSNHQAVLLDDGQVLIVGGGRSAPIGAASGLDVLASALLYDPATDEWMATGSLAEGRSHFAARRLPSGRVLVAGGGSGNHENGSQCTGTVGCGPLGDTLSSAEIYDPATGAFTSTDSMSESRSLFTMTILNSGEAIAVAGMNDFREGFRESEIFDESTETWRSGPTLSAEERVFHAAALLPSGRVLVGGGKLPDTYMLSSVEVLDVAGAVEKAPSLSTAHTIGRFVELESGNVLSVGGFQCPNPCGPVGDVELFNERDMSWLSVASLQTARAGHTATRLADGRVLVVGGFSATGNLSSCEVSY